MTNKLHFLLLFLIAIPKAQTATTETNNDSAAESFTVYVKNTKDGKQKEVEVNNNYSPQQLKECIAEEYGTTPDHVMGLTFGGKPVGKEGDIRKTIQDYNIIEESYLQCKVTGDSDAHSNRSSKSGHGSKDPTPEPDSNDSSHKDPLSQLVQNQNNSDDDHFNSRENHTLLSNMSRNTKDSKRTSQKNISNSPPKATSSTFEKGDTFNKEGDTFDQKEDTFNKGEDTFDQKEDTFDEEEDTFDEEEDTFDEEPTGFWKRNKKTIIISGCIFTVFAAFCGGIVLWEKKKQKKQNFDSSENNVQESA